MLLQLRIWNHERESVRERRVAEPSLLLLQLEVRVHRQVECVEPTSQYIN